MEYIQLYPAVDSQRCNPTKQQKSIYDFYESRYREDADDIYSSEWYHRTIEFIQRSTSSGPNALTRLDSWEKFENLEFGPLFLSHPIAAYAFWQILNAFYDFDRIVCGTSLEGLRRIKKWKELKPFVYLKSWTIRNEWKRSLNVLKKEIECGILEEQALLLRLHDVLGGVSGLENAFDALRENFAENLRDMMLVDTMLEKVAEAIEERRHMIANLLRLETNNPSFVTDGEESTFGTLGESFCEIFLPLSEQTIDLDASLRSHGGVSERETDLVDQNKMPLLQLSLTTSIMLSIFIVWLRQRR